MVSLCTLPKTHHIGSGRGLVVGFLCCLLMAQHGCTMMKPRGHATDIGISSSPEGYRWRHDPRAPKKSEDWQWRPWVAKSLSTNPRVGLSAPSKDRPNLWTRPTDKPVVDHLDPGASAPAVSLPSLSGTIRYPSSQLPLGTPIIVHVHDNRSAAIEAMWSDVNSLMSLVVYSPNDTHYVFLSAAEDAAADALWMKSQFDQALVFFQPWLSPGIASRLHYVTTPVWKLNNWMPSLLKYWAWPQGYDGVFFQVGYGKGGVEVVFEKRLDARYDWLPSPYRVLGNQTVQVSLGGNGCQESEQVKGKVALVSSQGDCGYFTKVYNMEASGAKAVLVYSQPNQPLKEMICQGLDCFVPMNISASLIPYNHTLIQQLQKSLVANATYGMEKSSNFYFAIDEKGLLAEIGGFLYPSFQFLVWQAQWFEYKRGLAKRLASPDTDVYPIINQTTKQGHRGVVNVTLPADLRKYSTLELDLSLSCSGKKDETCPDWDYIVTLNVCCNRTSPLCGAELGRWINPFKRGIGRWLTPASPLLSLLSPGKCTFTMGAATWAKPWFPSLNLRMSGHDKTKGEGETSLRPYRALPLYTGAKTFDKNYNSLFKPVTFNLSSGDKKVEVVSVITGHGYDENGCGEFCVTSHHFVVNNDTGHTFVRTFDNAANPLGCAEKVLEGVVPNEYGTWLYGRDGWCDGQQVDPWVIDITPLVSVGSNNVTYYGWFNGKDPDPKGSAGYMDIASYLVFYRSL